MRDFGDLKVVERVRISQILSYLKMEKDDEGGFAITVLIMNSAWTWSWSYKSGVQGRSLCQIKVITLVEITQKGGEDRRESQGVTSGASQHFEVREWGCVHDES